jgi:FkbM family methyltransferase
MKDYSQHGEQGILIDYFAKNPSKYSLIVDVGAYGAELSNSMGLLREGWVGLLIEANPSRIPIIEQEFASEIVKIINCGVYDVEGEMNFYHHDVESHSSFLPGWIEETKNDQVTSIKVRLLADILKENYIPTDFDVLTVDAEGMDEKILASLMSSDYRPRVIVVEKNIKSSLNLYDFGYSVFSETEGNLLFEKNSEVKI